MRKMRAGTAAMLLTGAIGCAGEAADTGRARGDSLQTASNYTVGTDSMGVDGTPTGDMLGAPALVEPVRLELERMAASPEEWAMANRTAHRTLLSDLVQAMQADLIRLGVSDTRDLQALADTVMSTLGGGTGIAEQLEPEEVPQHVERVERLIALYEAKAEAAR